MMGTNFFLPLEQVLSQMSFYGVTVFRILNTGCVSESGDFKNVMSSKCFHLFSFNTYEHNVQYI
jgi:hypothetical protein